MLKPLRGTNELRSHFRALTAVFIVFISKIICFDFLQSNAYCFVFYCSISNVYIHISDYEYTLFSRAENINMKSVTDWGLTKRIVFFDITVFFVIILIHIFVLFVLWLILACFTLKCLVLTVGNVDTKRKTMFRVIFSSRLCCIIVHSPNVCVTSFCINTLYSSLFSGQMRMFYAPFPLSRMRITLFRVIFSAHYSLFASLSCHIILHSPPFKQFKTFAFVPRMEESAEYCDTRIRRMENNDGRMKPDISLLYIRIALFSTFATVETGL